MTTLVPVEAPTLGVLGGMGPAAGVEFLRRVTELWPARRDQDHPRILLLSDPTVADRSAVLQGEPTDGADPRHTITDGLRRLAEWGARLLAVPCNTAFGFVDPDRDDFGVPLLNTVQIALDAAMRRALDGAWLLATDGTVACGLYQRRAERAGYDLRVPPAAVQRIVQRAIDAVKSGDTFDAGLELDAAKVRLSLLAPRPFLQACTELPLASTVGGREYPVVDSLEALALACVERLATAHASINPASIHHGRVR